MIQTVLGPIAPDALGVTLMHEHLRLDDEELAALELRLFSDAGGRSLVELTVEDVAPALLTLRRIAERTGVTLIAGIGFSGADKHLAWVKDAGVGHLEEHFVNGLWYGISGTPVRGGLLGELGTSTPVHSEELKVLRAAARAQRRTGVGIMVATDVSSRQEHRILDLLQADGVDLRRVALSHMDALADHEYLCSLAVRGVWLSFNALGKDGEAADERKLAVLERLLQAGWAGQLLLSQCFCSRRHYVKDGEKGQAHVLGSIVPALTATGISKEAIEELLVANPRRYLSGE